MNEFKIKNGLIINNTQLINGISNDSGLTYDSSKLLTMSSSKKYIDSAFGNSTINTEIIYNNSNILSGTNGLTFSGTSLKVEGDITLPDSKLLFNGAQCIKLINKTGAPSIKGKVVKYFDPDLNNFINTIIHQTDNKILIGGEFTLYNDLNYNRIIRLNSGGTIDSNFIIGSGFDQQVNTFDLQSNGKILVGGNFTTYNGQSHSKIIRLDSNGTIDSSFGGGVGFDTTTSVNTIKVLTDDKILVGGNFNLYNNIRAKRIVKLNSGGTIDTSFMIGAGFQGYVNCIKIQPDNKILVGGNFSSYDKIYITSTVKINSSGTSLDMGFNDGFNGDVNTSKKLSNSNIVYGGNFTYHKTPSSWFSHNYLCMLDSDGAEISSFDNGIGFDQPVNAIGEQSNSKLIIGGDFTMYSGLTSINYIVGLNLDGSINTDFNVGSGFNNNVKCITIQSNSNILVGGNFTTYNGTSNINYIVRLDSGGTIDPTFNTGSGFDGVVRCIKVQPDGKILVGGDFTSYNGTTSWSLIRLDSGGTIDTTFGSLFNGYVYSIDLQSDGKIIAGGNFSTFNSLPQQHIIRLNTNGTKDSSFTIGDGFSHIVTCVKVLTDDKIMIGGNFTTYSGITSNRIVKLNSGGTIDTSFITNDGFNNMVLDINVISSNVITINGSFTQYGGTLVNNIIRLNTDGTRDTGFTIGNGFDSAVNTIDLQSDGRIIVGGLFNTYNSVYQYYISRLESNGTLDTSFNTSPGYDFFDYPVNYIKVQSDNKILVGGEFTIYNPYSTPIIQNRISRLESGGTLDTSFNSGGLGFDNVVNVIDIQSDGKLLVGGGFKSYNNSLNSIIVRLNSNGVKDISLRIITLNNSFIYYQPDDYQFSAYVGITTEDDIIDGDYTYIAIYGICQVRLDPASSYVMCGNKLDTYSASTPGGVTCGTYTNTWYLGRSLESGGPGDLVKMLLFNRDWQ